MVVPAGGSVRLYGENVEGRLRVEGRKRRETKRRRGRDREQERRGQAGLARP